MGGVAVVAVGLLDKIHLIVGRSAGAPADDELMMASQMVAVVVAVAVAVQGRTLDFGGEPRCLRSVEVGIVGIVMLMEVGMVLTIRMAIPMTGMIPGKRETISAIERNKREYT